MSRRPCSGWLFLFAHLTKRFGETGSLAGDAFLLGKFSQFFGGDLFTCFDASGFAQRTRFLDCLLYPLFIFFSCHKKSPLEKRDRTQ